MPPALNWASFGIRESTVLGLTKLIFPDRVASVGSTIKASLISVLLKVTQLKSEVITKACGINQTKTFDSRPRSDFYPTQLWYLELTLGRLVKKILSVLVLMFFTITAIAAEKNTNRKPSSEEMCGRDGILFQIKVAMDAPIDATGGNVKAAQMRVAAKGLSQQIQLFCSIVENKF